VGVEQGLEAQVIARHQHLAALDVQDRDRKLPAQAAEALRALLLVEVHDRLGVAVRAEGVALLLQLLPQRLVVVDLPVEDQGQRPVLVVDRLLPAREVDDAQPAHAERDARLDVIALVVGPAMHHGVAHRLDPRAQVGLGHPRIDEPRDPAHRGA